MVFRHEYAFVVASVVDLECPILNFKGSVATHSGGPGGRARIALDFIAWKAQVFQSTGWPLLAASSLSRGEPRSQGKRLEAGVDQATGPGRDDLDGKSISSLTTVRASNKASPAAPSHNEDAKALSSHDASGQPSANESFHPDIFASVDITSLTPGSDVELDSDLQAEIQAARAAIEKARKEQRKRNRKKNKEQYEQENSKKPRGNDDDEEDRNLQPGVL